MMEEVKDNLPTYSVSELSGAVKTRIEESFGRVRVRGELGRVAHPASGHIYFDLKDDRAVLAAVVWRNVAAGLTIAPEQGLEVIITGRLTTFEGQSRYQIIVETLEPAGKGALMALLEARRKALTAEGLFDDARKKPLPFLPECVGVITSPSGAVVRDILHRLADRFPRHVLVWAVNVQGKNCADDVANAIAGFNALPRGGRVMRPDVLIVARGGGSLEDLWGFNEEQVVRAVAASDIPLISAIGHETDTTLIDYAADYRAPTPTAAAEKAVPVRADLQAALADLESRRLRGIARLLEGAHQALTGLARGLKRPDDVLALPRQQLDTLAGRLPIALRGQVQRLESLYHKVAQIRPHILLTRLAQWQQKRDATVRRHSGQMAVLMRTHYAALGSLSRQLDLLSHEAVLQRGFALVLDGAGKLIKETRQAAHGMPIDIRLAHGAHFAARVEGSPSPTKTRKKTGKQTGKQTVQADKQPKLL